MLSFYTPQCLTSQTLNLGVLTNFACFSGGGAVTNTLGTINGDVGTHSGVISGSNNGNIYNANTSTDQARQDLMRTYIHLSDLFVEFPSTHAPAFGGGETIIPGVYSTGGSGSIGGTLTLDGQSDPDAYFVIKYGGAFTVGANAEVILINGAQSSNVFFISSGAISVAADAIIKGSLFSKIGAIGLGAGADLEGRMLTMNGAITLGTGAVVSLPNSATTIPIFCQADCAPAPSVNVLGVLSNFALYTNLGAVSNTAISGINGTIGTNSGNVSGYGTSIHIGTEEVANPLTAQAQIDINSAYIVLMNLTSTPVTHGSVFGSIAGETLFPGVYDMPTGSLGGTITLDALGNPDAIFVMRFAGALTIGAGSKIILANGAKHCNVFWIGGAGVATGAISIAANSVLKGTFLSHGGACTSGADLFLAGRLLSTGGAVTSNSAIIYNNPECITSLPLPTLPLPIELLDFTAMAKKLNVQIDWSTVSETNNDYFTIERSKKGLDWERIAIVNGAGNSNQLINYNLIDNQPYFNISYYRLKQTDFDGEFTYSDIKSTNINSPKSSIKIYPNPTNGQITIHGDKEELNNLKIYNVLRQDLTNLVEISSINKRRKAIDLTRLSKGLYIIQTTTSSTTVIKK